MKVSVQHDIPHDEFVKRFGGIAGASYDEAHAALLRAQGIRPVSLETNYSAATPELSEPVPVPVVQATPAPQEQTDLSQLYGLFIALADAVAAEREKSSARFVDQERALQATQQELDALKSRIAILEMIEVKTVDDRHASAA